MSRCTIGSNNGGTTLTDPEQMQQEFSAALLRAGLDVPPTRRAVLFRCYLEVRGWSDIIRRWETTPTDEPANIYDIRTVTRMTRSR
jgi:hypothetical protein